MRIRSTTPPLSRDQVEAIGQVATIAAAQAGYALSRILRIQVRIIPSEVTNVRLSEVPSLFGGLDSPAIGVLVPFQGDRDGNAVLLFPEEGLRELEQLLADPDTTSGTSPSLPAFSELGKTMTGALLTTLSSLSENVVVALPPLIVQDMAGAILDSVLAEVGNWSDEVAVLVFKLVDLTGSSLIRSVLIPGREGLELFLEAADRLSIGP